jgi:hypothetical protein
VQRTSSEVERKPNKGLNWTDGARRTSEDVQKTSSEIDKKWSSRAQIEEKETRRTTFEEYIRTCYALLSESTLCLDG